MKEAKNNQERQIEALLLHLQFYIKTPNLQNQTKKSHNCKGNNHQSGNAVELNIGSTTAIIITSAVTPRSNRLSHSPIQQEATICLAIAEENTIKVR